MSVIELGAGNTPQGMFTYEKGGKKYILMNTKRFMKAFGPSPYWTVRIDYDLLRENTKVNEKALRRLKAGNEPATDRAQMMPAYHGVMSMARLDDERALGVRSDGKGGFDLVVLALP